MNTWMLIGACVGAVLAVPSIILLEKIIKGFEKREKRKRQEDWDQYERSQINQVIYDFGQKIASGDVEFEKIINHPYKESIYKYNDLSLIVKFDLEFFHLDKKIPLNHFETRYLTKMIDLNEEKIKQQTFERSRKILDEIKL